jgi:hypothetical protein
MKLILSDKKYTSLGWKTIEILFWLPSCFGRKNNPHYVVRTPTGITYIDQATLDDEISYEVYVDAKLSAAKRKARQKVLKTKIKWVKK